MAEDRIVPGDPLGFIQECIADGRVHWTHHVNMRMMDRFVPREIILESATTYEIIESYAHDKYLPSYLVYFQRGSDVYHVLIATDVARSNDRIVTAYRPEPDQWSDDLKSRKRP